MARRQERSVLDDLFELLIDVPWWVGPILSAIAYAGFMWFVPWVFRPSEPTELIGTVLSQLAPTFAPWVAGVMLVVWLAAETQKLINRRRFDQHAGIESIRAVSWQEFEELIAEAYRRQGYLVEHTGKSGPDGGTDHRLFKDGKRTLVQCKHWRREQVGVAVVRELLGVMTSENADAGIVVTSGSFTIDAIDFARSNRMTLIDGNALETMMRGVRKDPRPLPPIPTHRAPTIDSTIPPCPRCGASMIHRTAKRGFGAGQAFWGCPNFPSCKGTRPIG